MPQIGASISNEMIEKIKELAKSERRSFSEMVSLLLEAGLSSISGNKEGGAGA